CCQESRPRGLIPTRVGRSAREGGSMMGHCHRAYASRKPPRDQEEAVRRTRRAADSERVSPPSDRSTTDDGSGKSRMRTVPPAAKVPVPAAVNDFRKLPSITRFGSTDVNASARSALSIALKSRKSDVNVTDAGGCDANSPTAFDVDVPDSDDPVKTAVKR